ncbi:MAP kinase phosphatase with leucine-rich repeats protein 3-like [Oopsacas minuta]|uniref:MAP kinase phosphatase with leucine-rich repeats protein 3-like n=1 Tax=Oopsacas minuta TaxID=111878 RepID=A0AAV7JDK5_9METZ|nr:MAP kinase phosphatase with leucine-rich repeats protein 3-like [Oopsacas minuta]
MAVAKISFKNEIISEIQEDNPEILNMLEKRVLELCHENLKGITERHIREDQPDLAPTIRMKVINKLLANGKLELCKQGSTLVYRLKEIINLNAELNTELRSLDVEQMLVYKTLESVKGKGMVSIDVRRKTSLPQVQVTKILKYLEKQGLAQSIKLPDVTGVRSKVYLLSNFDPDPSLINREKPLTMDELDVLFLHMHKLLLGQLKDNTHKYFSSEDILAMKAAHIPLSFRVTKGRLDLVLQALHDEGKLELDILVIPLDNGSVTEIFKYRAKEIKLTKQLPAGITFTPCVMCSLIDRCQDVGIEENGFPEDAAYIRHVLRILFIIRYIMSASRGKIGQSDSFSKKQILDLNNHLSPTDRRSFFSPPEYGRLPLLLRVRNVELDRGASSDAKWGFSLRNIQAQYSDGDTILISVLKKVTRGSISQIAGLTEGDQILSLDDESVHTLSHQKILTILQDKQRVKITYLPAKFRMCTSVRVTSSNLHSLTYLWSLKRFLHTLEIVNVNLSLPKMQLEIGVLSGLKSLVISKCQLANLSKLFDLMKLSKLESLNLTYNKLTETAIDTGTYFAFLYSVTRLYLGSNMLTAIPECIFKLTRLEVLSLVNNKITHLPTAISKLINLQLLCLDNNLLKSIDTDLSTLPNLTCLSIANNDIDFASQTIRQEEFQAICIQGNPYEEYQHTLMASRLPRLSDAKRDSSNLSQPQITKL